jgi:hypothetical protein
MTNCSKHKKRGGSKPALSSCLTHTAAASQCASQNRNQQSNMLTELQNTTGGGKNRRGGGDANETCPGTGVSTVVPTYISGGNNHMSPNANENTHAAMQLQAVQKAQSALDSTKGWSDIKQGGGGPSLENFIENINSMAGGKKRKTKRHKIKTKRRKRYRVDTRKKRYKHSRYLRGRTRGRKRSRLIKRMRRRSKK